MSTRDFLTVVPGDAYAKKKQRDALVKKPGVSERLELFRYLLNEFFPLCTFASTYVLKISGR